MLDKAGVQLLVDPMSFQYLVGAEIDYKEDIEGLAVRHPQSQRQHDLRLRFVVLGLIAP